MRIVKQSVALVAITPDALQIIEQAGRTCYKSEEAITEDSAIEFVRMIIKRGHESVLEHASATFRFVCDRGVSHELVRHRIAAYSQESTRYCDYAGELDVIVPNGLNPWQRGIWEDAVGQAEEYYIQLREAGAKPQVARHVLPISVKTEVVATMNFREWRHVLRLRTSPKAHPHIRVLMEEVGARFASLYPVIVEDILC